MANFEEAQGIWRENKEEVLKVGAALQKLGSPFINSGFQLSSTSGVAGAVLADHCVCVAGMEMAGCLGYRWVQ